MTTRHQPSPGRRAALPAALLLVTALVATPAAAFLPGALTTSEQARLVAAGAGGVAPARALRLQSEPGGPPTRWNLLVVLVDFPDVPGDRNAEGPAEWHRRIFGSDPARPSLRDYYRENSAGGLELQGLVTSWVRMEHPFAYYVSEGEGNRGGGIDPDAYPHNAQRLVEEAVQRLGDAYRWEDFDNNADGLVDGLLLVAAGDGADETAPISDPDNRVRMLAHQFHATFEVPVPGSRVFDYALTAADAQLGIVAHEVGHLFGLIDLYQTGPFTSASGPFGVGDWSLMGTGALLDEGRAPSHLDAWSKARLGFVVPEVVGGAGGGYRLAPAARGGPVLRLGREASPGEYFLVETRLRTGFDAALPGEGLLVYHVFESSQTNSSPSRYKVAVVQADDRNDLGRVGGNRGDSDDPWPLLQPVRNALTESTSPDSRNYDGSDSGVRLTDIRREADAIRLDAAFSLPPGPRVVALALREVAGNGDGVIGAGETGVIDVTVDNPGGEIASDQFTLALAADDLRVSMEQSLVAIGAMGAGERRVLTDAVRFQLVDDFPDHETMIPFQRIFAYRACLECPPEIVADTLMIPFGPFVPFADDIEGGESGWSHAPEAVAGRDQWHRSTRAAHSGSTAWHCGPDNGGSYARGMDASLSMPPVRVPPQGRLVFWQMVAAESLASDRAWDGGRIEVRFEDEAWQPLAPVEPYPFTIESGSGNALFGADAYSGQRGWHRRVADLSAFAGSRIDIRFRFASDLFDGPSMPGPEGWLLDDVSLEAGTPGIVPVAVLRPEGGVEVSWDESEPAPDLVAWRVSRRPADAGSAPVPVARVPAGQSRVVDDPPPGSWLYRLEGEAAGGVVTASETPTPLEVPLPGEGPEIVGMFPIPFRPTGPPFNCEILVPTGQGAALGAIEVFDVQGRRVADLPWTSGEGTVYRLQWDGQGERGPLRSGIYWVRLRWSVAGGGSGLGASHQLVVVS